ncbi:hypothetical protein [Roseiconus lacunae]|uniref:hypothetical protein n=1 Tax=Roseiconus lacunae TaxID=2605694 RepID=UPI0011F0E14C|nr:hypothetical protein [Roseiconus lacunae]
MWSISLHPQELGCELHAQLTDRLRKVIFSLPITVCDTEGWGVIVPSNAEDVFDLRFKARERSGRHIASKAMEKLRGKLRVCEQPGSGVLEFELSLTNTCAASHPGGTWGLGNGGAVWVQRFTPSFCVDSCKHAMPEKLAARLILTDESRDEVVGATDGIAVTQLSSGGENWDGPIHQAPNGQSLVRERGYVVSSRNGEFAEIRESAGRAFPIMQLSDDQQCMSVAVEHFWANFPIGLAADGDKVKVELFSSAGAGPVELQGGEQKTFRIAIAWEPCAVQASVKTDSLKSWMRRSSPAPPVDSVDAEQLPPLLVPGSGNDRPIDSLQAKYRDLVQQAIEGDDSFWKKSESIDQFGWRNFGDLYGDHEAVFHQGEHRLVSHYNNQYDCTLGFLTQYLLSGDERWWDWGIASADHAWDIDTYHTSEDKLVYNGGLFWHTYHYADAGLANHRSYPAGLSAKDVFSDGKDLCDLGETGERLTQNYLVGGGPAASHNYSTGWMYAYYLTGREMYRDAAVNAADYVMRIEDGKKTPFCFLSLADTGHSTCSSEGYFGPGRASANSTHALLTGHELTQDRRYLTRAESLMRRTVHPNQDLQQLDLLNAELRWFYTMYLQALSRYVDYKCKLKEFDESFRYGVASLLLYANWMAENECPTLSKADELQYPTETWAAQDMRKWQVLEHSARYELDPVRRERLQVRAEFFFRYVVNYLSESPTKSLCRPVVLMMNFGWQREWYLNHRNELAYTVPINDDFGEPTRFVPQRAIAVRRFKALAFTGALATLVMGIALIGWFVAPV